MDADPNAALLVGAPIVHVNAAGWRVGPKSRYETEVPRLPMTRVQRGLQPLVCAAYRATCVPGSAPPRAWLSLAGGVGGLGLGGAASPSGWRLSSDDFCKGAPRELLPGPAAAAADTGSIRRRRHVPTAETCFCPTYSLDPRAVDPLGFPRRVPAGGLPGVPRLSHASFCRRNAPQQTSYITYQCSRRLLLPPPLAAMEPAAPHQHAAATTSSAASSSRLPGAWKHIRELAGSSLPNYGVHGRRRRRGGGIGIGGGGGVHVLLATSDHFGHGLFAMVQRVLNQIHLARREGLEPAVFLGERTFMEPQVGPLHPSFPRGHTPILMTHSP